MSIPKAVTNLIQIDQYAIESAERWVAEFNSSSVHVGVHRPAYMRERK